jgi:Uma2 family endonuclease
MSEEEFVAWCDEDTRAEWVDGEVVVMSPASWIHSRLARFLISVLGDYVDARKLGEVVGNDFTVRLRSNRRRIPDVLFIANERVSNLREKHLEGAPNLAIEIVSDDSVDRDRREKFAEYAQAGVEEYWVVDPLNERVEAYLLAADKEYHAITPIVGKIASVIVPGFYLRPEWLWQKPLPEVRVVLNELLGEESE